MAQAKISPAIVEAPDNKAHFIGLIPDVYREKGLGGREQYNVIVSYKTITFALIKSEANTGPAAKIYAGKTTEEVLAENKRNFSVERGQMKSFKFIPGHSYTDCCRKLQEIDGELEIVAPKAKYSFYVPFRRNDIAKSVLERAGLYLPEAEKPDSETAHSA
jgi:hypothetical protein